LSFVAAKLNVLPLLSVSSLFEDCVEYYLQFYVTDFLYLAILKRRKSFRCVGEISGGREPNLKSMVTA